MKTPLDRLADHIGTIMVSTGLRLTDHLHQSDLDAIAEEIFEYFGYTTRPWIDDMSRAPKDRPILVQLESNAIYIAIHKSFVDDEPGWFIRERQLEEINPVRWQPMPKNKSTENIT